MKAGYCKHCGERKRKACETAGIVSCAPVIAELKRIETGYRKKRIHMVLESEMVGIQATWWNHIVYGAGWNGE